MRVESIQESRDTELPLTAVEAMHLDALGKRLTSKTTWWGETDEEEGNTFERSVIRVRRTPAGSWTVRVTDAVGVIAIPGLQITVKPKIPLGHLLHLLAQVDVLPRMDEERTEIEQSIDLFELTARWFLSAAEQLVRLGLVRDYEPERRELPALRGRLEPLNTALLYYSGHLAFDCEYEEFTYNSPLNRVIRAAAHSVVASPLLPKQLRARAMQVGARIEEADDLRPGDTRVEVDRRTAHYRESILLAKTIIRSLGRAPLAGGRIGWTFLIRTPEAVEDALRLFLAEALPDRSVHKTGLQLTDTALTISPDLVFSAPPAIGDVKYKLSAGEWVRSDLYQLVAFATGFRVQHALLVRFREPAVLTCRDLMVGDVHVSERTWPADPLIPAATAAGQFVDGVRDWIASCALPGALSDKQLLIA